MCKPDPMSCLRALTWPRDASFPTSPGPTNPTSLLRGDRMNTPLYKIPHADQNVAEKMCGTQVESHGAPQ